MTSGVIYKWQKNNKINGSLFYCFEYYSYLAKNTECKFYIVGISSRDLALVKKIFLEKYQWEGDGIEGVKPTQLYQLDLDKSLVLDIKSFYGLKAFMTNEIYCFSNEAHELFRYKDDRVVKYFGSYEYQDWDEYCLLKLNFDVFKYGRGGKNGVFISCPDYHAIEDNRAEYLERFAGKEIVEKKHFGGFGNLFEMVDTVLYVHTRIDTNNRIIPEAFYHNCEVIIDDHCGIVDSVKLRFEDIEENGLENYTLSAEDVMIQAMLG